MIAACFAIGSIGFFLAVLLQHDAQGSQSSVGTLPSLQARDAAMQSLAASEVIGSSTPGTVSATSTTNTTTSPSPSAAPAVPPMQADSRDPNAAAKLKLLQSLNSQ